MAVFLNDCIETTNVSGGLIEILQLILKTIFLWKLKKDDGSNHTK